MDAIISKINAYNPQIMSSMSASVVGSSALKVDTDTTAKDDRAGFSDTAATLEISTKALDAYEEMYGAKEEKPSIPSEAVKEQIELAIEAAKERAKEQEELRNDLREVDKANPEEVTAFAGYSISEIREMYFEGKISFDTYSEKTDLKQSIIDDAMMGSDN